MRGPRHCLLHRNAIQGRQRVIKDDEGGAEGGANRGIRCQYTFQVCRR